MLLQNTICHTLTLFSNRSSTGFNKTLQDYLVNSIRIRYCNKRRPA